MSRLPNPTAASFLPEDYRRRKHERRHEFITLALFCIVMFGVVAAFFVTNRQWATVKVRQQEINKQYTQEAKKIEQLKVLEAQKAEMLDKADITTALIEKVPRSILMAELINRMPQQLTLTQLKLVGKRIKEAPPPVPAGKTPPRSLAGSPVPPPGKAGGAPMTKAGDGKASAPVEKPRPPKFDFTIALVGLSQADSDVADYQAALQQCPLLEKVDLLYSGEVIIDDVSLRKFRIEATIKPTADARQILPLHVPRLATHLPAGTPAHVSTPTKSLIQNSGINSSKPASPGKKPGGNQAAKPGAPRKGIAGVPDNK